MTKTKALENCLMLARREKNRVGIDVRTIVAWMHIIRFCDEAGVKAAGILRKGTSEHRAEAESERSKEL